MPDAVLSLADLARWTGEQEELLSTWRDLGLLGVDGATGFTSVDITRVRLLRVCVRRGLDVHAIAATEQTRALLSRWAGYTQTADVRLALDEAADQEGLPRDLVRRMWSTAGLDAAAGVTDDDLEALRAVRSYLAAGLPEEAIIEGSRVYADALGRVAEMESRLFHFYVHERLAASGLSADELADATLRSSDAARPLLEPTLLWFHRKKWERAVAEDLVWHLAEEFGLASPGDEPGEMVTTAVFADLSGFTPLTYELGDAAAARVLDRFSEIVRAAVNDHEGRIVKQIGDEFFLVFPEARFGVAAAVDMASRVAADEELPAARCGVQCGPLLYRDGDYVGATVNLAARLVSEAQPHQVLVTEAVCAAIVDVPDIAFVALGPRAIKGLHEPVGVYEARRDLTGA